MMECNAPRYIKQPALMAPRTLLAVSEEVATDAPTITPIKLVHATAKLNEKIRRDHKVVQINKKQRVPRFFEAHRERSAQDTAPTCHQPWK